MSSNIAISYSSPSIFELCRGKVENIRGGMPAMLPNRSLVLRWTLSIIRCLNEEIEHREERGGTPGARAKNTRTSV
jgi:hypothetical protein